MAKYKNPDTTPAQLKQDKVENTIVREKMAEALRLAIMKIESVRDDLIERKDSFKPVTCRKCTYSWQPRDTNPNPKACPRCKTRMDAPKHL